jgi:hypothetical protein
VFLFVFIQKKIYKLPILHDSSFFNHFTDVYGFLDFILAGVCLTGFNIMIFQSHLAVSRRARGDGYKLPDLFF